MVRTKESSAHERAGFRGEPANTSLEVDMSVRNAVFRFTTREYSNLTLRGVLEAVMPKRLFKLFCHLTNPDIPDRICYSSSFKPYEADMAFRALREAIKGRTLVSVEPVGSLYIRQTIIVVAGQLF
jgi:hypothetical protein